MTHYDGPGKPEEDNSEELEHISEEDVLRQVEESIGDHELTVEIPQIELQEIKDFLFNFNVKGAEDPDIEDVDLLWHKLQGNSSLVRDFVYSLITWKEALNHSTYPLAVSWSEVLEYANRLQSPREIRPHLIARTAPAIARLGFDSFSYSDRALSESKNPKVRPDTTRYLGWLVSQNFLGDLRSKKQDFIKKHELETFTFPNLAAVVTVEVSEHLRKLDNMSLAYRADRELEADAYEHSHEQIIIAMRGIYRMCGVMFLNKGRPVDPK